jgi:hypothetical protein
VAVTLTFIFVATSQLKLMGDLGFVMLEQPRYHLGNGLRDRGRQTMAQHDPSSPAFVPVILHCGGAVLSAAIAPALSSYLKIETGR